MCSIVREYDNAVTFTLGYLFLGEEETESESVSATKGKENDKAMLKGKKSKKNDGKAPHKTSRRHMKKAGEKRGTVLTHTINKISQTPNAKLLQHGKSHTTSTSHLKQGARKRRSELVDFDLTQLLGLR